MSGLYAQNLTPIATHRPTQGIGPVVVEAGALQVESGFQPIWTSHFAPEMVVQARLGLTPQWEAFGTLGFSPALTTLALSVKHLSYHTEKLFLGWAAWGYLPLQGVAGGGQLWLLGEYSITRRGILTLNLVGSYFSAYRQVFSTVFYTHAVGKRASVWGEVFLYAPASVEVRQPRYGWGAGGQLRLGPTQRTAIDLAFNHNSPFAFQLLIGLSRKMPFLRR
ncbi:MAG: hypothetical protein N3A68_02895 [Bacteroidia bacterium]|nr:hypothetical protein [Bacteroidia bacterium]